MNNDDYMFEIGFRNKMKKEHTEWMNIFQEMEKVFDVSRKELNKSKYRKLFVQIEKWAYADRMKRQELPNPEKYKGTLWIQTEKDKEVAK